MKESFRTRLFRYFFNIFPAYRRTGGRVTYIAADWREIRVRLPLNFRTRNYVGTIFGGSIFGAVDPMFMIMLIKCLGPEYLVWDRSAKVRFKRPGKSTLFAICRIEDGELEYIRSELREKPSLLREYRVELVDDQGLVHAWVDKTIYLAPAEKPGQISNQPG